MRPFTILPVLLVASGCWRSSPEVVFHTLRPLVQETSGPAPTAARAMEVMPVILPELLQRPQLVSLQNPGTLSLSETHRWGNSLDKDLQRVLTENLGILLGSSAVVSYPYGERAKAIYRLTLDIQRCEGRPGGLLELKATWALTHREDGHAILMRQTTLREPVPAGGMEALAATHSRILEALSRQIADELKPLPWK